MPSKLPSFIRLDQCLNAIATAFLRRAFAGAILAQRHFPRSPHTISAAACGSKRDERRVRSQGAPSAHIVISTARRSRGNCSNLAALISIARECRWSNAHRGGKNS
jgi:hypothetical protein